VHGSYFGHLQLKKHKPSVFIFSGPARQIHSRIAQMGDSPFWRFGVGLARTRLKECEMLRALAEFRRCKHPRAEVTSTVNHRKNIKSIILRIVAKGLEIGRIFWAWS
jgi:hypothetical protein